MRLAAILLLSFVAACSQDGGAGDMPDAATAPDLGPKAPDLGPDLIDNGAPSTNYPAPFPTPPQVESPGGPVLAAPKIVPVFFMNDDPTVTSKITDFLTKVGTTNYWKTAGAEYGVGPASATLPIALAEAAPTTIDDSAIQLWLQYKLNTNDAAWPVPDKNTVYVISYPSTTTITQQGGRGVQSSCTDFGGYHGSITLDAAHFNRHVAYAVIPRCDTFGNLSGLDALTGAASHELLEASTDPYPRDDPAYATVDTDHFYWQFILGGGEIGDLCAQDPASFTMFAELPYVVQRTWSNNAVAAGHDPCVPSLDKEVYFAAAPELNDTITAGGGSFTEMGVVVPVGTSKTVTIDLFSDGDTNGDFAVQVMDSSQFIGGLPSSAYKMKLDRTTGVNGEKVHVTIQRLQTTMRNGVFVVTARIGVTEHFWLG
jgi:hypothetical protein